LYGIWHFSGSQPESALTQLIFSATSAENTDFQARAIFTCGDLSSGSVAWSA